VRDRPSELQRIYRRFQQHTDLAVGLVAGLLFVTGRAIIGLLYDARYQDAGQILSILAIGSIGARMLVVEQIYLAMGRTSLLAAAILPRVVILLVGVPVGFSVGGLAGALAAIILSQFAHWPLAIRFRSAQHLGQLRNDLFLPVGISMGFTIGWGLTRLLPFLAA
jgi:O-antigen/teichoic acid export membrane protein